MEPETPRRIPADDLHREQYLNHSFDLVARVRAAKEAAQREMETFGDVSEYEIRKIYGQRTDLTYDQEHQKEEVGKEEREDAKPSPREQRASAATEPPEDTDAVNHSQFAFDFTSGHIVSDTPHEEE